MIVGRVLLCALVLVSAVQLKSPREIERARWRELALDQRRKDVELAARREAEEAGNAILREVYQELQGDEDEQEEEDPAAPIVTYNRLQIAVAPVFTDCKNKDTKGDANFPSDCFDGDAKTRVRHLGSLIQAATQQFAKPTDGLLSAFVSSEWFFRKQQEAFSKDEMTAIISGLKKLSLNNPTLLLAPGTIFWGVQNSSTKKWVIFNCAPILMGGELLTFHCKSGEDDHLSYDEVWGPSTDAPLAQKARATCRKFDKKVFTVGNLRIGVDICLDHTTNPVCGALSGQETLDVLLLEAASMHFHPDKANKITKGGVVIRCDGAQAYPEIGAEVLLNGNSAKTCTPRTIFDEATNPLFSGWVDCATHTQVGSSPVDYAEHLADLVYVWQDVPVLQKKDWRDTIKQGLQFFAKG